MLDYMDYIVRAFEKSTNWNRDSSYENITSTSRALLEFHIPKTFKFQTSNRSTTNTFSTLEIDRNNKINGSLTYLYTDADNVEKIVKSSSQVLLQDATETYRHIQPFFSRQLDDITHAFEPKSLYYGRIYYPKSTLEAMIIKRFNVNTQLVVKCISNMYSDMNIMLLNWQRTKGQNLQEFVVSSNGLLCGYRVLHNFISSPSKFNNSLYNNSSMSLGGEVWLGLSTLTPGCSTTLRYCTNSANTGRPLTLTFSWNPLFGHISSSYTAMTTSNSTISAKYDFNLFSIDSNLSFGCEFWKSGSKINDPDLESSFENVATFETTTSNTSDAGPVTTRHYSTVENDVLSLSPHEERLLNDLTDTFSESLQKMDKEKSIIERFKNKFRNENFTQVWKFATSLRDRNLKILWEGKFREFLISAGTELVFSRDVLISKGFDDSNNAQNNNSKIPAKFGIKIQYSV
ncbi:hypothetical protein KAFR_0K00780 [Kazachstania africana CBS 2517]|uniref:Mitochondrial distribution and morphology protein 10 n=1 Tax=Kazachstania africana (strain ATCC 22294 / BCRC 22015 / CBS 2517 / CECT 1963 / NBRC 1671 / NRRL Y-8276) TaxID=1071382 RepID=H2B1D3_KAZAF|nr:hypothetical protein KAFR_0K00780 [Kazachstania africana CBS 2517]CCF60433.1 hypothetical protein KAFR_0K00780 [Kazachstania africana CBS 2517]